MRLQTLRLRQNEANRSNPHPVLDIVASPDKWEWEKREVIPSRNPILRESRQTMGHYLGEYLFFSNAMRKTIRICCESLARNFYIKHKLRNHPNLLQFCLQLKAKRQPEPKKRIRNMKKDNGYVQEAKENGPYVWVEKRKQFPPEIQPYEKLGKQYDAGHPFLSPQPLSIKISKLQVEGWQWVWI